MYIMVYEFDLYQYIYNKSFNNENINLNNKTKIKLNLLRSELKHIYKSVETNNEYKIRTLNNKYVKGELFKYIPIEIQEIITVNNNNINTKIFEWSIKTKENDIYNIKLNINYSKSANNRNIKYVKDDKLVEYYILTRTIMEFLINQSTNNGKLKNHKIDIYLYLTKHIKLIPTEVNKKVGWIHINTGVTIYSDEITNSEINIYRAEEWFKTLIHEGIHNLGMDFNGDTLEYYNKLKRIFIVDSDYLLFETYTEVWAEIIQILFISILNNKKSINERFTNEFYFSLLQSKKIFSLCTMNKGTYNDLINKNNHILKLYKEDTNCFSYFILKMVALYKINEFIFWCDENNNSKIMQFTKSNKNIISFINFFEKYYKDKHLIKLINKLDILNEGEFIKKTTRISIHEILI